MEGRDSRSYYQVVQDALVKLGGSRGRSPLKLTLKNKELN